ncbi:MAG: 4-hydroxythreonine-4-phosphate dehydrogenase PdxA [Candidatus Latescibacteria bacterium]|nr:4-hydroxythreonine-4-phosphate dehydrogenase PdxA [Candidatus Latescibacterota bacterium]
MNTPVVLITLGDPAGVGPEVIVKAFGSGRLPESATAVVVGPPQFLNRALQSTAECLSIEEVGLPSEASSAGKSAIPVINTTPGALPSVQWRKTGKETGKIAAEALVEATKLVQTGEADALVTGPVCKQALNLAGYNYPGQTEMLAHLTGTQRFAMMLVGGGLRVALVTTHCAVSQISQKINRQIVLEKLEVLHQDLKARFGIASPRIGVCALNPHAGEGGLFGREEIEQIQPAINQAKAQGIEALGPFPADTLFARRGKLGLDAVLAIYHDQGLIPLKLASFGRGVNVTLGLPIIRTSPDHGTALDIAGQGIADPASLIEAFKLAASIALRVKSPYQQFSQPQGEQE